VRRLATSAFAVVLLAAGAAGSARAQTGRHLTTIDALRRFSGYYHLQNVVLRGELVEVAAGRDVTASGPRAGGTGGSAAVASGAVRMALRGGDDEMQVLLNDVSPLDGPIEVRGQLIDVGRLTADDPRLARYDNKPDAEHWPKPGEELLLSINAVAKADPTPQPTIRALALEPWKFEGQSVTVTGQFGGRNLFGDLPAAPAKDKYEFVMRNVDAAVWVTGLQPKGKNFNLNVDARVDTSHWLSVTGTVRRDRALVIIEAKTMEAAVAPAARPVVAEAPPPPKEPGEVVFSSPTDGETGVPTTEPIRIQFSRGIEPPSINGKVRLGYVGGSPIAPEDLPKVDIGYDVATHAVQLKLSKPLEPFRTVKLELLDGVKTFDGAPIKPWSVTFSTGAN
jgi:hypothetical protein